MPSEKRPWEPEWNTVGRKYAPDIALHLSGHMDHSKRYVTWGVVLSGTTFGSRAFGNLLVRVEWPAVILEHADRGFMGGFGAPPAAKALRRFADVRSTDPHEVKAEISAFVLDRISELFPTNALTGEVHA